MCNYHSLLKCYCFQFYFFAETDNFFEAFGLNDKPSSSQLQFLPSVSHKDISELQLQQASVQGSGFWTDAWGSFFEMKGPGSDQPTDSKNENLIVEENASENSFRKDNAVLSQPHRGSLFPNDSTDSFPQNALKPAVTSVPQTSLATKDIDSNKDMTSIGSELLLASESQNIVTLQPSSDCLSPSKREAIDENSNKEITSDTEVAEDECYKIKTACEVVNPNDFDNVPKNFSVPDDNGNQCIDESQYLSIQMPADSSAMGKSEYDVIEMSDSDVSNNTMENSSESFTRSASVEIVTSMSQSSPYNISSSTLEIPDLPENMAENLGTWEWSAMENVSSDIYASQNENTDFDTNDNSQSIQLLSSSETSFHTITASSFSDNRLWIKSDKSSHFADESPNSSNGEQNSHHSDGSSNSSKDDNDTDTAEAKEYDAKSSSSNGSRATSSSSFVKCSVDDNDNNSHRGPSPISTTASEKSDVTKHESEQNTSGDEIETATSSDIEILSPPNGENGDRNSSPLKHIWLARPLRFRRSESPTSDSSKDGSIMPAVSEVEEASAGAKSALYVQGLCFTFLCFPLGLKFIFLLLTVNFQCMRQL